MKHFLLGLIAGVGITAVSATALTPGWQHSFAFPYRGSPGITKREYAAIMAMQGLLAHEGPRVPEKNKTLYTTPEEDRESLVKAYQSLAHKAWAAADALAATSSRPAVPKECNP